MRNDELLTFKKLEDISKIFKLHVLHTYVFYYKLSYVFLF